MHAHLFASIFLFRCLIYGKKAQLSPTLPPVSGVWDIWCSSVTNSHQLRRRHRTWTDKTMKSFLFLLTAAFIHLLIYKRLDFIPVCYVWRACVKRCCHSYLGCRDSHPSPTSTGNFLLAPSMRQNSTDILPSRHNYNSENSGDRQKV